MSGLEGKVLAITRGRKEAAGFSRLVKKEGGRSVPVQTIEIVPEGRKAAWQFLKLLGEKEHDYCAFMSAQAVAVLFELGGKTKIASALGSTKVIAVGPKTRQELERRGVRVAMMPDAFSSIGLAELLSKDGNHEGKKIMIPRSGEAGDYAAKALSDLGMSVDEVFLYTVRTARVTPAWKKFYRMLLDKKIDAIVFTSASNVRSFFEITDRLGSDSSNSNNVRIDRLVQAVVSIGPFTSAELKRRKVEYHEAKDHTVEGTVQAARKLLTGHSG